MVLHVHSDRHMKPVTLFVCGLLVLGAGLYFSEGFLSQHQLPRPSAPQRVDGMSSIRLSAPDLDASNVPTRLDEASSARVAAASPTPQAGEAERPVGTAGAAAEPQGSDSSTSDANRNIDEMLDKGDRQQLIGKRVQLRVQVQDINNDPAFWVGSGDKRMLVVVRRDTRDNAARQEGLPSKHGIEPIDGPRMVAISGTIQRMPRAEEAASWNLTKDEKRLLASQGVYIQADRITPEG